jgi:hypothetical protein
MRCSALGGFVLLVGRIKLGFFGHSAPNSLLKVANTTHPARELPPAPNSAKPVLIFFVFRFLYLFKSEFGAECPTNSSLILLADRTNPIRAEHRMFEPFE